MVHGINIHICTSNFKNDNKRNAFQFHITWFIVSINKAKKMGMLI